MCLMRRRKSEVMDLSIDVTQGEKEATVKLSGEIDVYTAQKLKDALIPLTLEEGMTLTVDLDEVTYMDSTGLGIFINVLKSSKENASRLQLINLQKRVYRLFTITGLDQVIDISAASQEVRGQ